MTIDKSTKHQIIQAAINYADSKNLSQDAFTDHVKRINGGQGFSVAYWNDLRKGKIVTGSKNTPISDKYFMRIAKAINFQIRKSYRRHHDTDNFVMYMNTFSDARESRLPYAIDNATGESKSYTAAEYLRQNPKNTYIVRCDGDLTAKSFFVEMAYSLGMAPAGPVYDIRKNIIKKLKDETDALVIIDEAENLKDRAWESLKRIMDDLKGYTGIVFIGSNNFEETLQKKANKMKGCFPQILRRLREGGIVKGFQLSVDDTISICKPYGITSRMHVKALFDKNRNTAQLIAMVEKVMREADQGKRDVLDLIEMYCNVNLKKAA